jgi:hypothetical protein
LSTWRLKINGERSGTCQKTGIAPYWRDLSELLIQGETGHQAVNNGDTFRLIAIFAAFRPCIWPTLCIASSLFLHYTSASL